MKLLKCSERYTESFVKCDEHRDDVHVLKLVIATREIELSMM